MPDYAKVLVESYLAKGEASRSEVRVRPIEGQPFPSTMHVECSKEMRLNHPVGTCFEIQATLKQKLGGEPFLYTSYRWPPRVIGLAERAASSLAEKHIDQPPPSKQRITEAPPEICRYVETWLERLARAKHTALLDDIIAIFEIDQDVAYRILVRLGRECLNKKEPIISAIVVDSKTQRWPEELAREFPDIDDLLERTKLHATWIARPEAAAQFGETEKSMSTRAIRFALVATRPEQARFRKLVFLACRGRCVVSGCDIPEALDAAHKRGRHWSRGDNNAGDGWLLRKDIHALYDKNMIDIAEDGSVGLSVALAPNASKEGWGPGQMPGGMQNVARSAK